MCIKTGFNKLLSGGTSTNLALQKDLTPCAHQKDSGAACLVQSVKRAILDLGREF